MSARWLIGAALTVTLPLGVAAQIPEEFTNLEVLPEDISRGDLLDAMRSFTGGLGVRCSYCHVGEEGQPLSEYDFASDEKPEKRKARFMMRMAGSINEELLSDLSSVATRATPAVRVTCETCHRGIPVPRTLVDVLTIERDERGAGSAVARYRELRERYYGSGSYDFGQSTLLSVAQAWAQSAPGDAVTILELQIEQFPEFVGSWISMGQAKLQTGDNAGAIEALERAKELSPDNRQIDRLLQQARGG